ncbi:MAG: glycosyltransferase family 4 protein [Vicinamibacterales bacterium]
MWTNSSREDDVGHAADRLDACRAPAPTIRSGFRVAMVIQRFRPDFGGQGVQVEELCRALARRGIRPTVLAATRGRPSNRERCDGYEVRRLRADVFPGISRSSRLWNPLFGLRVFLALMRLPRMDVVHVHGLSDALYGALMYCRLRSIPLVFEMTLMGVDDPATALATSQLLARRRRAAYRACDAYVAMSAAFLPSYAAAGLPPARLSLIPQGVDLERFRPRPEDARALVRAEFQIAPSDRVVVFVGSLIERKGIDLLLAAWSKVHQQTRRAHLVLVGRNVFPPGSGDAGFLAEHMARLSAEAAATVHVAGLRDQPEAWMSAADVFAFPSRREGFGSVIIEAMACGLPCVVATLDGITDLVFASPVDAASGGGWSGDGVVVPQDDVETLSAALLRLIDDRAAAAAIGAAARARARAAFDMHRVIAPAYERLYGSLSGQASA